MKLPSHYRLLSLSAVAKSMTFVHNIVGKTGMKIGSVFPSLQGRAILSARPETC
jgi:hypothetical protein